MAATRDDGQSGMTDQDVAGGPEAGPRAGHSSQAGVIAGGCVGLVICAVVGALGGYLLAGDGGEPQDVSAGAPASASAAAPPSATPKTTRPSANRTSRPPSPSTPPVDGFSLPDLVGEDFDDAREELRGRGLGVQLIFGGAGSDPSVARTDPPGGSTVRRGITVKVYVRGAAPPVAVPDLLGESCRQAARELVDQGLYPGYPTGDKGEVRRQDPPPGSTLRWNDRVQIYCGSAADPTVAPTY